MFKSIDINTLMAGDYRQLARAITLVENDMPGGAELLRQLPFNKQVPVIGLTGPPGAGKSSLVSALITFLVKQDKKVGIIAVDPTSPFNFGSLLGDRIRMSEHFNHPNVFIRSLATRGSLGGLSAKIFEVSDVMKNAGFDVIIIETVGVGQSEVEIAGIADTTAVVLVPEAGDEVQTLKSGLMEIADIFVINKSDREGADIFVRNLSALVHGRGESDWQIPVLKTVATTQSGVSELWDSMLAHSNLNVKAERATQLMVEKAYQLIMMNYMKGVSKEQLLNKIKESANKNGFNLYQFLQENYFN